MALHPAVIHFPLAFLIGGTASLLWSLLARSRYAALTATSRVALEGFISGALGFGFFGLILSVATGLMDMLGSPKAQALPNWITLAVPHIIGAMLTLLCYGILLYRRFVLLPAPTPLENASGESSQSAPSSTKLDKISLGLALVGLLLLLLVGWLGGRLVYDYRVGIN